MSPSSCPASACGWTGRSWPTRRHRSSSTCAGPGRSNPSTRYSARTPCTSWRGRKSRLSSPAWARSCSRRAACSRCTARSTTAAPTPAPATASSMSGCGPATRARASATSNRWMRSPAASACSAWPTSPCPRTTAPWSGAASDAANAEPRRSGVLHKPWKVRGAGSGDLYDPQRIAPFLQQLDFAFLGLVQVLFLDVAVAADVFRNRGDLGGEVDVAAVERTEQAVDRGEVIDDQLALHPALLGPAEDVERTATQEAQLRQPLERGEHPRAEFLLDQVALCVLLRQQRRGEVELELVVAVELLLQLLLEVAAGVQARDFVLVLVRHQLEGVTRDGFGQVGGAGDLRGLGFAYLGDEVAVALGVGRILVIGEEADAARDQFVER